VADVGITNVNLNDVNNPVGTGRIILFGLYLTCLGVLILACVGGIVTAVVYVNLLNTKFEISSAGDLGTMTNLKSGLESARAGRQSPPCTQIFARFNDGESTYVYEGLGKCATGNTVQNFISMLCSKGIITGPQIFTMVAAIAFLVVLMLYVWLRYKWNYMAIVALEIMGMLVIIFKYFIDADVLAPPKHTYHCRPQHSSN
jgi:hypothetical protein